MCETNYKNKIQKFEFNFGSGISPNTLWTPPGDRPPCARRRGRRGGRRRCQRRGASRRAPPPLSPSLSCPLGHRQRHPQHPAPPPLHAPVPAARHGRPTDSASTSPLHDAPAPGPPSLSHPAAPSQRCKSPGSGSHPQTPRRAVHVEHRPGARHGRPPLEHAPLTYTSPTVPLSLPTP